MPSWYSKKKNVSEFHANNCYRKLFYCSVCFQRLSALDDGWKELLQMWDSRQQGLSQDLNLQVRIAQIFYNKSNLKTYLHVIQNHMQHFIAFEWVLWLMYCWSYVL